MKDSMAAPAHLAEVIPLFPGAMFTPEPPTRWSRLRDALPPTLAAPHVAVAFRVAATANGLHRLASWMSGGELSADPAADWADLLIMYARGGGDVASLRDTDERRQAAGGGGLSVP